MPDYSSLFEEVLKQKTGIGRDALQQMVEEKKRRVGSGYLTDQGAIFLVAADLNVSLEKVTQTNLTLSDLYIGANEITVIGRVFAVYPVKQYSRRDGSAGAYRRLILRDGDVFAKVTLWDDHVKSSVDLGLKNGMFLRVVKGYVKAGLDGRPVLNVGGRGSLEVVGEESIGRRIPVTEAVLDVMDVSASQPYLSILGALSAEATISEYNRQDGSKGRFVQLRLRSTKTEREFRVVIWEGDHDIYRKIRSSSIVRIVNVRSRVAPNGEIEFQGDESSFIETISASEIPPDIRRREGKILRILSIGPRKDNLEGQASVTALAVDSGGKLFTLSAKGEAYDLLLQLPALATVECRGFLSGSVIVCADPESITQRSINEQNLVGREAFSKKISDLKEGEEPVFVESISLSRCLIQDVTLKDGSVISRGEVTVGDETGEVKVVAWRELAVLLQGIDPAQRLKLNAVGVRRGRDGLIQLQVRAYTSIEKVS